MSKIFVKNNNTHCRKHGIPSYVDWAGRTSVSSKAGGLLNIPQLFIMRCGFTSLGLIQNISR
jgi:hypothetical protein